VMRRKQIKVKFYFERVKVISNRIHKNRSYKIKTPMQ
jgi:hypothetical protein